MDLNLHPPLGPMVEFQMTEQELYIYESILTKLLKPVEESKTLGYRHKDRLTQKEREFFFDLLDRTNALKTHLDNQNNQKSQQNSE